MDLSKLNFDKAGSVPAIMYIEHPATGERINNGDETTEWTLSLVSMDSDEFKKAQRRMANVQITRVQAGKRVDAEEALESSLDLVVACTKGFANIIEDGKDLEFSREEVRRLYQKYGWLRDQAWAFVNSRANFLKNL